MNVLCLQDKDDPHAHWVRRDGSSIAYAEKELCDVLVAMGYLTATEKEERGWTDQYPHCSNGGRQAICCVARGASSRGGAT